MSATKTEEPTKQQAPVYTTDHPEFPKLLYNAKLRTTSVARDKDDEGKLQGKGFSEDPYPPLPADSMTAQDMQQLEGLLKKMLAEVSKYGKLQLDAAESQHSGGKTDTGASGKPPAK